MNVPASGIQNIDTLEVLKAGLLVEEIDENICKDIDRLTKADNTFWSSPNHNRSEYLHSFFQYPAMMVPIVQKKLIEIIVKNKPSIQNVIDPYMGSGTSLVACMENGLDCFGQDINPLAILVARTRTGPYYVEAIEKRKDNLFHAIDNDKSQHIEANFVGLNKWFKESVSVEISKIVRAIRSENRLAFRRFFWVVLAEAIRLSSNDRTSTFKLHIRSEDEIKARNISPISLFKEHFETCLEDLKWQFELLSDNNKLSKGAYIGYVNIKLLDTKRAVNSPSDEPFFDLLVTSPPYGDNKTTVTYGQHSYLPLQWLDLEDIDPGATDDFLKTTSEIDSRGLGGKLNAMSDKELDGLFNQSLTFKKTYDALKNKAPDKLQKVASFINDLHKSIVNIHSSMKIDSYQVWTIGNRNVAGLVIPNNEIITELICSKGAILIKQIKREILNKRMAKRNKESDLMTFEDILIFRKIGNIK